MDKFKALLSRDIEDPKQVGLFFLTLITLGVLVFVEDRRCGDMGTSAMIREPWAGLMATIGFFSFLYNLGAVIVGEGRQKLSIILPITLGAAALFVCTDVSHIQEHLIFNYAFSVVLVSPFGRAFFHLVKKRKWEGLNWLFFALALLSLYVTRGGCAIMPYSCVSH